MHCNTPHEINFLQDCMCGQIKSCIMKSAIISNGVMIFRIIISTYKIKKKIQLKTCIIGYSNFGK